MLSLYTYYMVCISHLPCNVVGKGKTRTEWATGPYVLAPLPPTHPTPVVRLLEGLTTVVVS